VQWARAGRATIAGSAAFTLVHGALVHGLAAWLVVAELSRQSEPTAALLLVLWVMTLVWLAEPLGLCARVWPTLRNLTLRLLEPLGAPEAVASDAPRTDATPPADGGVAIELTDVTVHAGGHELLREVSLSIPAGSHVAVVGASGAGKSSLCGLLLGWHLPTTGTVRVDGEPLGAGTLEALRRRTAWLDPEVQLWNRSLAENVRYGAGSEDGVVPGPAETGAEPLDLADLCAAAELHALLPHLPEGLQTVLGESGALVSGGEGQRVRAARAFGRRRPRLVVLDEALRGLDRERRRALLDRARARFADATLIHVTHRLDEALGFGRVVVVDAGRVVEDGAPAELAADPATRFAGLLAHERACDAVWHAPRWRRLDLDRGRLTEVGA
jgi:ATP-binding cassette subfamily B protein